MRPSLEHVPRAADESWTLRRGQLSEFAFDWHHHEEVELTWIQAGAGLRFIGDSVEPYRTDDLILIGPRLPHAWRSFPIDVYGRPTEHSLTVVQFRREFLGSPLLATPEFRAVEELLTDAEYGLAFDRRTTARAIGQLATLDQLPQPHRTVRLLELLSELALSGAGRRLSRGRLDGLPPTAERARLQQVLTYIDANLASGVDFADAAALVHLTPAAFSRFFRRTTGQTFTGYVASARIARACQHLIETDLSIATIAARTGFANLPNFNRRFREHSGLTPTAFRRHFRS